MKTILITLFCIIFLIGSCCPILTTKEKIIIEEDKPYIDFSPVDKDSIIFKTLPYEEIIIDTIINQPL